ncbi:MAG: hypothetical protein IJ485_02165 [Lachnospiraceae bacterium]|nr:hypothetical protein [Lachnospiraceae bacterium]
MSIFLSKQFLTGMVILLLLLSIICQIIIGVLYQMMIQETDNMAATKNKLLMQCKAKFANCYQLHSGVANIPVFVDKFLNKIQLWGISFSSIEHLGGQLMLLSVFAAGIGVCKGIIDGETLGSLLPYYIGSLFGLYVYFSVSSLIDVESKKRVLKTNLVDYLENNLAGHLDAMEARGSAMVFEIKEDDVPKKKGGQAFGKAQEQELEELLKEFLT